MDKQVFKLIRSSELNESFRINVAFEDQGFTLTVLQKLKAWSAAVDRKKISVHAKQLEVGLDEYFEKIREYLLKSPENVEFTFTKNEFVIHCSLENKMRLKYFTCKLKEVDYGEYVENLTEKYYTENNNALRNLRIIEEERHNFEKEKNNLEVKLNEFIERKKTDDEELYSNFALVLNEKKMRIQHLSDLLEAFRRGRPTVNQPVQVKKRTKKSKPISLAKDEPKKEISDTESEDSYDTDEEKQKLKHPSDGSLNAGVGKSGNMPDPVPSTSKCEYDPFSDDSPPRHLLPKRVRTESSVDVSSISKVSSTTSKPESDRKDKENIACKMPENSSPDVDINTQELLDNI